ncbi:hypothetical protein E1B28_011424 [Marasmius oreades]|uniref:XLF-like N-terminal domain-containing protein n=1 Tax=Marasmius oreades TaxID=181124 RepID=A0A9P7RUT0_9AGAR|nr:uncharacterized protein E1B28_011424 [Marasmius oreades]KAG7089770.1 hypothetical protein E1B28_011424 [Marasmius oreades]
MEKLSEEHAKLLLNKEWLAKTGTVNSTSKPYLFKFCSSTVDISCLVLITDTKSVWAEVLNSNQFARRWRDCNSLPLLATSEEEEEEEWRENALKTLTAAHTVGGMTDFSFEVVESRYSDFAFALECKSFKWRWETCFIGHKLGSEIISQHLVLPLISVNHLAFTSADALGEIVEPELEKGIDKVGRSARRAIGTHIKNAISKPRLASTLRRMTAMYNFLPDLPSVISTAESPNLDPPLPPVSGTSRNQSKARAPSLKGSSSPPSAPKKAERRSSPSPPPRPLKSPKTAPRPKETSRLDRWTPSPGSPQRPKSPKVASPKASTQLGEAADSATESDEEEVVPVTSGKGKASETETDPVVEPDGSPPPTRSISPAPGQSKQSSQGSRPRKLSSQSESSPQRPAKKKKAVASRSSDVSEDDTSRRAPAKSGASTGVKRGTRQPMKRGGKRF